MKESMESVHRDDSNRRYVIRVCLVAAMGGLLFGYDTAVISGAIGFLRTCFELDATQMGWAASSALVGCIIGCAFAGILSDWMGRKKYLFWRQCFLQYPPSVRRSRRRLQNL